MSFTVTQKILFKHCDGAGIVFYPRYFEIINDCVEAFFFDALDFPFENLHDSNAIPTAQISTTFTAPSRHGDILEIELRCLQIGKSSLNINLTARCGEEVRFNSDSTLVYVGSNGLPQAWPEKLNKLLNKIVSEDT